MKCPHLQGGYLIFPRESWECPADVAGFERESNDPNLDGAWRFKSLWPACLYRGVTISRGNCKQQKITVLMTCLRTRKTIELSECQSCNPSRS